MPEGLGWVIALLAIGYLLLLAELFVPGGVLGVLGASAVIYGCYLAFEMGPVWGGSTIALSIAVTAVGLKVFFRSGLGKRLYLSDHRATGWKAQEEGLEGLLGRTGRALTPLRPAGLVAIGELRVDVVAEGEFLDRGQEVEVVEVEGNRVVVEAVDGPSSGRGAPDSLSADA